jgi:PAS domain S-box-containing protein
MSMLSGPVAMMETLLARLPVGVLVHEGRTGKCILANPAAADFFGESIETLRQQSFQEFVSGCRLSEAAANNSLVGHHEVRWQTAYAKFLTLACCLTPFDYEDQPYWLSTISDISEDKRTQEKLEQERALLRCVIDSVSDLIFLKDRKSVYRACNKASEAFIGMSESEQVGKTDYDFFDWKTADRIRRADRKVMEQGKPLHYEEWTTRWDGRRLLIDTIKSPYYDSHGNPQGIVGIGRDLTDRKRLEQEHLVHLHFLKNIDRVNRAIQANSQLERMMSDVLDVVFSIFDCHRAFLLYPCDPRAQAYKIAMEKTKAGHPGVHAPGVEIAVDPKIAENFRLLLGYDGPVKFGPEDDFPIPAPHGWQSKMSMALHPRIGKPWEFSLHHCSDAHVWTDEEERLFQEIGWRLTEALSALLAQRDLQRSLKKLDQRVLERTAQLEGANEELESFAYSVSHDLRAPLRHIEGFLELLQKRAKGGLDEQGRHHMDAIADAAKKMGILIDDLLTFSRMGRQAMSLRQVALEPLARDVIRELEPDAAGRTIVWRIGDLPVVKGDKAMLRMVLVNLIDNALKFSRIRQQAEIEIGSKAGQGSQSVIFVSDNGAGFDMAYADKLFGVFQRLHRTDEFEGIGIGLANVRRLIARHGGRTWAEGVTGRGATFYFSLPYSFDGSFNNTTQETKRHESR